MASKTLINLSNLQQFLSKLNEKFALKKTMKGISEDSEGNIIIGEEGLVPTPNENSKGKFLRSDGEWALPSETAVYDSMTIEEGIAGVSEVDKVLNAKNLKQIVNSDGFLTSLDSSKLTGVINIENLPQGALERILIVSSKEERLTLSDTEVQLGDVVKESDTGLMYYVINTEKLNSEEGYTQFTAGMASSVPWSGVTNKPLIPTKTSELTNDSNFAIDSNVVHRTGDEHISGNKIFSNTIHRYADLTTSGAEQVYRFVDTNANGCGHIYNNAHWAVDTIINSVGAFNEKTGKTTEIHIVSNDAGGGMAFVEGSARKGNLETVTSATDHTAIATMGWVNNPATSTNVVHRSGNETITGTKTFNNNVTVCGNFYNKNVQADLTQIPTSDIYTQYRFVDKNDKTMGHLQHVQKTTGIGQLTFIVRDSNNVDHGFIVTTNKELLPAGNNTYSLGSSGLKWANVYSTDAHIESKVVCHRFTHSVNDGHVYISGGSEHDKGATLVLHGEESSSDPGAFIISSRDKTRTLYLVGRPDGSLTWSEKNLITTEFVKGTNYWYRKHSDGFIEMGGFTNCGDKPGLVVETNLPIAFSNANYTLSVQLTRGTGSDYILQTTSSKSTTRFEVCVNDLGSPGSNRGGYDWYACGY